MKDQRALMLPLLVHPARTQITIPEVRKAKANAACNSAPAAATRSPAGILLTDHSAVAGDYLVAAVRWISDGWVPDSYARDNEARDLDRGTILTDRRTHTEETNKRGVTGWAVPGRIEQPSYGRDTHGLHRALGTTRMAEPDAASVDFNTRALGRGGPC